jgi:hypothetical protein
MCALDMSPISFKFSNAIARDLEVVLRRLLLRRLDVDLVMPRNLDLEVVQLLGNLAQLSAKELAQRPGPLQHSQQRGL